MKVGTRLPSRAVTGNRGTVFAPLARPNPIAATPNKARPTLSLVLRSVAMPRQHGASNPQEFIAETKRSGQRDLPSVRLCFVPVECTGLA
jgi:hypothetical protein